jgi:hypothetical protein
LLVKFNQFLTDRIDLAVDFFLVLRYLRDTEVVQVVDGVKLMSKPLQSHAKRKTHDLRLVKDEFMLKARVKLTLKFL